MPLKGFRVPLKGDIDMGVDIDVDTDIDSDVAVRIHRVSFTRV